MSWVPWRRSTLLECLAPDPDVVRVINLGAGVNSTALIALWEMFLIPHVDEVLFADTGAEPAAVYRHVEVLKRRYDDPGTGNLRGRLPIRTVSGGNLLELRREGKGFPSPPFHLRGPDGSPGGMSRRGCTSDLKVRPLTARVRELMAERGAKRAEQWMGIGPDEVFRLRDSREPGIDLVYPLVDLGLRRADCLRLLERMGFAVPEEYLRPGYGGNLPGEPPVAKSGCIVCPYRSDAEWRRLRDTEPESFRAAAAWEERVQAHGMGLSLHAVPAPPAGPAARGGPAHAGGEGPDEPARPGRGRRAHGPGRVHRELLRLKVPRASGGRTAGARSHLGWRRSQGRVRTGEPQGSPAHPRCDSRPAGAAPRRTAPPAKAQEPA